jgi:hypothetical protein
MVSLIQTSYVFSGNYHAIAEALAESGILAFGHDHVGHGQSEGIPAYIESVDDYVNDLVYHCQVRKHDHQPRGEGGTVVQNSKFCAITFVHAIKCQVEGKIAQKN